MAGFVEGVDRGQSTLFPALLDDYVAEENPVRAVDVFVNGLDLDKLGFVGVQPERLKSKIEKLKEADRRLQCADCS
jgi:transposase